MGDNRRILKTRIQFEMPIGINQHVQEHCVQMAPKQDACRRVTEYAAWALSTQQDVDLGVAACKAWCSEAHEQISWHAHQVLPAPVTIRLHMLPLTQKKRTGGGVLLRRYSLLVRESGA